MTGSLADDEGAVDGLVDGIVAGNCARSALASAMIEQWHPKVVFVDLSAGELVSTPALIAYQSAAGPGTPFVAFGSHVNYVHNPPASGDHWPWPATWGVHNEVLAREWWVHNLEHQGIVLLYNCPAPDAGAYTDGGQAPNDCPAPTALSKVTLPVPAESVSAKCVLGALSTVASKSMLPPFVAEAFEDIFVELVHKPRAQG